MRVCLYLSTYLSKCLYVYASELSISVAIQPVFNFFFFLRANQESDGQPPNNSDTTIHHHHKYGCILDPLRWRNRPAPNPETGQHEPPVAAFHSFAVKKDKGRNRYGAHSGAARPPSIVRGDISCWIHRLDPICLGKRETHNGLKRSSNRIHPYNPFSLGVSGLRAYPNSSLHWRNKYSGLPKQNEPNKEKKSKKDQKKQNYQQPTVNQREVRHGKRLGNPSSHMGSFVSHVVSCRRAPERVTETFLVHKQTTNNNITIYSSKDVPTSLFPTAERGSGWHLLVAPCRISLSSLYVCLVLYKFLCDKDYGNEEANRT
eukprot:gene3624-2561_t